VFQRYNIVDETDLKDAVRKLDSYMGAKRNEIDQQKESGEAAFGENTVKNRRSTDVSD